jgi:hypothetical protein
MNTNPLLVLLLLVSVELQAASPPPNEHIHFMAEHLAEAAQDARYYAMPWPTGDYSAEGWRPLVSVAGSHISADMAVANGGLLTLGVSKNWGNNWATDMVAYYDRFSVSGGRSENALLEFSVNGVPLDLPEKAIFSNPQGEFTHTGVGIVVSHALDFAESAWSWDAMGGVLIESLELANYTLDYELTGGLDAGATGVLDHSGSSHFIYYVIGIQAKKNFADHYVMIPRFIYGRPGSDADFTTRLTGPGFELTTASTGAEPHNIGDEFGYFGLTIRDTQSHFEMDIGAILGFATYEYIAHEGVNTALVVSLTWRK